MRASWRGGLAALLCAGLLLPSVAAAQAGPPTTAEIVPRFEAAPCKVAPAEDDLKGRTLRCGYLVVPEQRPASSASAGSTLRLAVAILSSGHPAASEPVIYLSGGPGEAGSTDLIPLLQGPLQTMLDDHDWVFLDQRGSGLSEPALDCPEVQVSGVSVGGPQQVQQAVDCATRLSDAGVDLSAYTTEASAADVADLVRTLGYQQANLYGASYGTRLALIVQRDSPELVRAVIVDGVFPPQARAFADGPLGFSRALRLVFEACAADARCGALYPDGLGQFGHVLGRLHGQPVPVAYRAPGSDQPRRAMFDSQMFLQLLFVMLYAREGVELIPAVVALTDAGDMGPVASLLPALDSYGAAIAIGTYYSIECAEDGQRLTDPTLAVDELPGVGEDLAFADDLANVCAVWPVPPAPARAARAVESDLPTLLMVGHFDPITPPDYAWQTAQTLSSSRVVEFAVESHVTLSSSPCSIGIAREFLAAPDRPPETACASGGALEFVLP
jgi:pimeloyl-ACP methyl ester carboxylesterase